MADLTGGYFANNYQKAFAPFTYFGTRQLAIFYVDLNLPAYTLSDEELDNDNYLNPWYWPDHAVVRGSSWQHDQTVDRILFDGP